MADDADPIVYSIGALRADLDTVKALAVGQFVAPGAWQNSGIEQWRTDEKVRWAAPTVEPLCTRYNRDYEGEGKKTGSLCIRGEIAFSFSGLAVWDTRLCRIKKKTRPNGLLMTSGPKFDILIRSDDNVIRSRWVFDVAGTQHPTGPLVHVDVPVHRVARELSREQVEEQAPTMPLPRLLSWVFTLGDAVDFLLGELFPGEWRQRLGRNDVGPLPGIKSHRARAGRLFSCYAGVASDSGWQGIKADRTELWGEGSLGGIVK